jgi:flagellar biosynthesis/type III secretory pathway M-ring protein FliF/YscJ
VGAATNIAGAGGNSTTASGKSYTDFKRESQYVVDQQHLTTTKAPGKIESLSVAVLLDDSVKAPQEQAVTEYVNGVLGVPKGGPPKPNCNVTVAKTTFDQDQKKQVQKAAAAESSSRMMDKLFTIAPSLALIIAAVLVMRALGKPSIKLQAPELPEGFTPVLPHPGTVVVATESGGSGKVVVGGTPAQPQPAVIEVTAIPERFDIAKEQIVRMASEKPDTVALLIKSWMMEDRG